MAERTLRVPDWIVVKGRIVEIPKRSLAKYLVDGRGIETVRTIGDESSQVDKPLPKRKKMVTRIVDTENMSIEELLRLI